MVAYCFQSKLVDSFPLRLGKTTIHKAVPTAYLLYYWHLFANKSIVKNWYKVRLLSLSPQSPELFKLYWYSQRACGIASFHLSCASPSSLALPSPHSTILFLKVKRLLCQLFILSSIPPFKFSFQNPMLRLAPAQWNQNFWGCDSGISSFQSSPCDSNVQDRVEKHSSIWFLPRCFTSVTYMDYKLFEFSFFSRIPQEPWLSDLCIRITWRLVRTWIPAPCLLFPPGFLIQKI